MFKMNHQQSGYNQNQTEQQASGNGFSKDEPTQADTGNRHDKNKGMKGNRAVFFNRVFQATKPNAAATRLSSVFLDSNLCLLRRGDL